MDAIRLIFAMLCAAALIFLLRVLLALMMERNRVSSRVVEVYFARFVPKKRGELILMNPETGKRKLPTKAGSRIALITLASCLAVPLHGQQKAIGADAAGSGNQPANATSQPAPAEVMQELETMKKRIEQLETELKQRDSATPQAPATAQSDAASASSTASISTPAMSEAEPQSAPPEKKQKAEPFAFADWTWLNGNPRTKEPAFDSKFFTPEIRADVAYHYDFNHPKDDTIGGSSEVFRSNEVNLTDLGIGGDFHYDHVRARVLSQIGLYSTATPRNDASYSRGQWDLADAYRYVSEAWGGYHWDALHGVNVDAGIFLSYVGLFSFYQFDNWAYQPSYVSSNTPWFFTGMRVQVFPTEKLKIEPWIINGWQSYARYNGRLGFGGQVLYRPNGWLSLLSNNYGAGADALGLPNRTRYHTDNSVQMKYYDHPERFLDKMAFTVTGDAGCETGEGVHCTGDRKGPQGQILAYKQSFLGYMVYNRWWFHRDRYGFTLGGGEINNPGRYLVLLPPINGATATSGTPYFTENPGDPFKAWDMSATYDYMPSQYITFRWEFNHRHANVPYFSGPGGITPEGGNQGPPGSMVAGFTPDLRHTEDRGTMAILVKF
jgi:hypothetical protein